MSVINPTTFTILTYRPFEPTEISGLKGWWKADSINQADNTSVSAWLDSSGNEAHMYQSSATAQPTLQTNELNGYPVVRFDGTNDFMNLTAPFDEIPSAVATSGTVNNIRISKTGQYLVYTQGTTPFIFIYKRNGNVFNRISTPAVTIGGPSGISWSSDDTYLAIGGTGSPYVRIYKRSGDTFTALANPSVIPDGAVYGKIDFSSDDNYLAVGHGGTRRLTIYKRSGDTFTKLTDPAILPTGTSINVTFSNNADYLAVGHLTAPRITIYSRSGDVFTKLTDPVDLPAADVYSSCLSPDGNYLAIGGFTTPVTIIIYKNNGTSFSKLPNPSSLPSGALFGIDWDTTGSYLFTTGGGTTRIKAYSRSGDTFTALSDPLTLPTTQGNGISYYNGYLIVSQTPSPYIQAYTFDGTTLTNLTKLNMFRNVGGSSVFVVAKYAISSAFSQSSFATTVNTSSGSSRVYTGQQAATSKYMTGGRRLDADSFQLTLSTTTTTGGYILQTGVTDYNNSNQYIYINGKLETSNLSFQTDGLTSNTNSLAVYLGNIATEWLNGDIAEVIVYNRALTTAEIRDVHYYLSAKYNITLAT